MTEDFALVDFVLLPAHPGDVALALAEIAGRPGGGAAPLGKPPRPGLLRRWFGGARSATTESPLRLHPAGLLPASPLARLMYDELGFARGQTPFRVTAPLGAEALTLVEYLEADGPTSPVAEGLSMALPQIDVFYFRLSGPRHPGSETVFHVYRAGTATRRAASTSASGTTPEADWQVTESGLPHLVEADCLPNVQARAWEIMTPERQGGILSAMGIEPDSLFVPDADHVVLDLSTRSGGRDVAEAARFYDEARTRPGPSPVPEPEIARPTNEAAQGTPETPPVAAPRLPRAQPQPDLNVAPPQSAPAAGENWETEVTRLLVTAVAHALPDEEQVPWLTRLTARLEAGEVDQALAEAHDLIHRGARPQAERQADADRLAVLFGAADAQTKGRPTR